MTLFHWFINCVSYYFNIIPFNAIHTNQHFTLLTKINYVNIHLVNGRYVRNHFSSQSRKKKTKQNRISMGIVKKVWCKLLVKPQRKCWDATQGKVLQLRNYHSRKFPLPWTVKAWRWRLEIGQWYWSPEANITWQRLESGEFIWLQWIWRRYCLCQKMTPETV